MAKLTAIKAMLRRAVKECIREERAERTRRQESDARFNEIMRQLSAAQLVTEEKLQAFIDSLRRSSNGGSPKN